MSEDENARNLSSQSSLSSSDDSLVDGETLKSEEIINSLDTLADQISRRALKDGIQETVKQISSTQIKAVERRSYFPFSPLDLSMTQILIIVAASWIIGAVLKYTFLADSRLATRSPGPSIPFFTSNSNVNDFYKGNGASYNELYNQADLTILMFYAQWSLHSMEAKEHFIRLAHSFKDVDNVKFSAVNCDVGTCRRSFKLYSYPVIIALTSSNTAVLYEDSPISELMFSWVTKLLSPLHRIDLIDDPLLTNIKYDHVALAYLPLNNGQISHPYKVYQLSAMKFKDRVLFAVTISQEVANHFEIGEASFKVINTENVYKIHENITSANIVNIIHSEIDVYKHSIVRWINREYDDDGGKSILLHSMVNESRSLIILMTTPLSTLQTTPNLERMRKMALLYNSCSKEVNLESTDWAQTFVDESRLSCEFKQEMIHDCCNTMLHENFCGNSKKQSTDLTKLQYKSQCETVVKIFGEEKLHKHCCKKRKSTLQLSFEQQINCRYLKLFNSTNPLELSKYSNEPKPTLPSNLNSIGLSCQTNRTVQFAAIDRRFSGHFIRSWNLNTSLEDKLILISVDDEAIHSTPINDAFEDIDDFLTSYANRENRVLDPTIFNENLRKSPFSEVRIEESDEIGDVSHIERLTAHTFRTTILNDTNRTYSAVVFFSGGSWHGQSMAAIQVFHTIRHEFSQFDTLIRFFIIDTSRNSLPYAYIFDSLPAVMYFPSQPFPLSQSSHFPQELVFTVPNLMAFLLARVQPELRFRIALRGCSRICLETNRQRLHQFEDAVRRDIRSLRLMKRKYAHKFGTNFVTLMLRKRKLQTNAARYLQNVLKILYSNQSGDLQLSSYNETLIVRDSLLLRWLLSNNFGSNFNINHSFRL